MSERVYRVLSVVMMLAGAAVCLGLACTPGEASVRVIVSSVALLVALSVGVGESLG